MTIETDYGTIDYEEENLITFPDGLFGFPNLKKYLFLALDENEESMLLMISVDDSNVGFVLMNPFFLCPDYLPELSPQELSFLSAKDIGELSCYSICVVRADYLSNTVNLKCPVIINPATRQGMQVILGNSAYECAHEFRSFPAVTESAEVQNRKE